MRNTLIPFRAPGFLAARWRNVALLSWEVDDELLEPLLPTGLEIDHWGGSAYISLVGLWFDDVRVLGIPVPVRKYEEVNLRFYVRRPQWADVGGPGVIFIRQLVPHRMTAFLARRIYGEPFWSVPMYHRFGGADAVTLTGECRVEYGWRSNGRQHGFWLESDAKPAYAARGSLDEFLTARHWGYNGKPEGRTTAYTLSRPPWTIQPASAWGIDCDAVAVYGPQFGPIMSYAPSSALLASGSSVKLNMPRRLALSVIPTKNERDRDVGQGLSVVCQNQDFQDYKIHRIG